jgi:hypothetical protein
MPTVQDILFRCDSEQINYYCKAMQTLDPEPLKASHWLTIHRLA